MTHALSRHWELGVARRGNLDVNNRWVGMLEIHRVFIVFKLYFRALRRWIAVPVRRGVAFRSSTSST